MAAETTIPMPSQNGIENMRVRTEGSGGTTKKWPVHGVDPDDLTALTAAIGAVATQTTLAAILAKLSADPATDTKLEAVRALLAGNLLAVAPPPTSSSVMITSGQSLSSALQVDGKLAGILLPTGWTAAAVTFMGSSDDTAYYPIYDGGVERTIDIAAAAAGRLILLPLSDWLGVKFVKIRSGTSALAVTQADARTVTVLKVA